MRRRNQKTIEITGKFLREFFRRDNFFIGEIRLKDASCPYDLLKIKGESEEGELQVGLDYRFYGYRESHPKYGESFNVQTFIMARPHDRRGVILYLQQCEGIGPAIADVLWTKFQSGAVQILREQPEVAAAAIEGRFSIESARRAASKLQELSDTEDCSIDLMGLLAGRYFPKQTARLALRMWGNKAVERIKQNPYRLMVFRGCGFNRTDAMYLDLGLNPARIKRQGLCVWHWLWSDTEGHVWFRAKDSARALRSKMAGAAIRPVKAVQFAKRAGLIDTRRDDANELWLAEAKLARDEAYIARKLVEAEEESEGVAAVGQCLWPRPDDIPDLSDHQRERVAHALGGVLGILCGSPGTGKSYTAAAILQVLANEVGLGNIAAAAPTGKAAVRLTEALQGYGLALVATTHHRLLGVEQCDTGSGGGWTFRHNETNPLPYQVVVFDEQSMTDTPMMANLLAARNVGCHYLFIGDTNQLPPIGAGAPLRDMIRAGVPTGELREIHRNAGSIVRACAKIRDGERWQPDAKLEPTVEPPRNLYLSATSNNDATSARIIEILHHIRDRGLTLPNKQGELVKINPIWDVQVIVAVNKKSSVSRKFLNESLQVELNAHGAGIENSPFRVGDKVIQLSNGFLSLVDGSGEVFVANGDQGRVREVQEKLTMVEFFNPTRFVRVPRSSAPRKKASDNRDDNANNADGEEEEKTDTGCDLDLAYAVTGHKMQGSQAKVVTVALDDSAGAQFVCSREWLYTAISRAETVCILVGKMSVADRMCRYVALPHRKTFLAEDIESNRASMHVLHSH